MLTSGPPELPGLIAASVWMKSEIEYWLAHEAFSSRPPRPFALTMPAVTVKSSPSGLPNASTHSPTRVCESSPMFTRREVGRVDLDHGHVGASDHVRRPWP